MNTIRPISPAFRSIRKRRPDEETPVSARTPENLPAVTKPAAKVQIGYRQSIGTTVFEAQLLAAPLRRGLKASAMERQRYFTAYRPARLVTARVQQKWA